MEPNDKPKDYIYKLPADYVMRPWHRAKLDELVTNTNLTNEQAQAFVDLHVELTEDFAARFALAKIVMPTLKSLAALFVVAFFAALTANAITN